MVAMVNLPLYTLSAHLYSSHVSLKPNRFFSSSPPASHTRARAESGKTLSVDNSLLVQSGIYGGEILFLHFRCPFFSVFFPSAPKTTRWAPSTLPLLTGVSFCRLKAICHGKSIKRLPTLSLMDRCVEKKEITSA